VNNQNQNLEIMMKIVKKKANMIL